MNRYEEPVTQYELMHSIAYDTARFSALQKATIEFLKLSEEEEVRFNQRVAHHLKESEERLLKPELIKTWIDRANNPDL